MGKRFQIEREPFDKGTKIFSKKTIVVEPGVTVLVGCNGAGKTTMLRQIECQLKDRKYLHFDNHGEGDHFAMDRYGFNGNFDMLSSMFCSSEGERIMVVLGEQAAKIGQLARNSRGEDIYILMDAVDSGFSIDNVCELKEYLFQTVLEDHDADVYIICTANSYEMARGEDCIDVQRCLHRKFKDYDEYRDFILESRKVKNER